MPQAEKSDNGVAQYPGYPGPFTLILLGLPLTMISMWWWLEAVEEGSAFIAAGAVVAGALGMTMTLIGSIGHGVRMGMCWVDHDRRTSVH